MGANHVNENLPVPQWDRLPEAWTWKEKVACLAWEMSQLPQVEEALQTWHLFSKGLYYRMLRIPAGTFLVGRGHRAAHELKLLEGSVVLVMPEGKCVFEAPDSMTTVPGFHSVAYTLTDVVAQTVHIDTGERDLKKVEDALFEEPPEMLALGERLHRSLT